MAYPHLARNPVHDASAALAELAQVQWDQGNEYFPPTTFQISNAHAGTGATNVIPGELRAQFIIDFNLRFATASTPEQIKNKIHAVLDKHKLEYELNWTLGGSPFLTPRGTLSAALSDAIQAETGAQTELSTTGGTSDGRFIASICNEVIEFGPVNDTIHKVNENILLADIDPLKNIYRRTIETLLPDA